MLLRSLYSLAGLPVQQGHLYLQILRLFDRLKQLGLLQRREPACCPLPAALPRAARVFWQDTGQEGITGGAGFEFSSGKQRPLIPEVSGTFSFFHISIFKVDASSGFGYLWTLLAAGASAVHCNTMFCFPQRAVPARGELVCGRALGLHDL